MEKISYLIARSKQPKHCYTYVILTIVMDVAPAQKEQYGTTGKDGLYNIMDFAQFHHIIVISLQLRDMSQMKQLEKDISVI